MTQDGDVVREQEYGLKLPDGSIIWPPGQWHGCGFATSEEREKLFRSVKNSAANMGFVPEVLSEQYGWVTRAKITAVVYADYGDEVIPFSETGYVDPQAVYPDEPLDVETTEAGD